MDHKRKNSKKQTSRGKSEIAIVGYDLTDTVAAKDEVLAEVFEYLFGAVKTLDRVALKSGLNLVRERYQGSDIGSVGDGVYFIELGLQKGLSDYCCLLARIPREVDWKTTDRKKVRLVWFFGFPAAADREFVVNFVSYLSDNLFDPGVWDMLMGKQEMPRLVARLEEFLEADIKADVALAAKKNKVAREGYKKALGLVPGSSRVKTKLARLDEMTTEGKRVLKAYKDGK